MVTQTCETNVAVVLLVFPHTKIQPRTPKELVNPLAFAFSVKERTRRGGRWEGERERERGEREREREREKREREREGGREGGGRERGVEGED